MMLCTFFLIEDKSDIFLVFKKFDNQPSKHQSGLPNQKKLHEIQMSKCSSKKSNNNCISSISVFTAYVSNSRPAGTPSHFMWPATDSKVSHCLTPVHTQKRLQCIGRTFTESSGNGSVPSQTKCISEDSSPLLGQQLR